MYQYLNSASTGLKGCIKRASADFVDDFGNLLNGVVTRGDRSYFFYHSSYDYIYINLPEPEFRKVPDLDPKVLAAWMSIFTNDFSLKRSENMYSHVIPLRTIDDA